MSDAPPPARSGSRGSRVALAVTAVILALSFVAIGIYAWQTLGASELTVHGYIALVLGVIGTIGLGVGLMALVFYSHRYGYDERVGGGDEPSERR
jgi:heme/copper-type cytochrome/quinol oxidase subunit 3